jgi:FMN phosphatase YigB (HAD superfamily)
LYGIWINRRAGDTTDDQPQIQPDATLTSLSELPALLDILQVQ